MPGNQGEVACSGPAAALGWLYVSGASIWAGRSLWQKAIDELDVGMVQWLIAYDSININVRFCHSKWEKKDQTTPLGYALTRFKTLSYDPKFITILTLMLDAGADPNLPHTYDGKAYFTPLANFACGGRYNSSNTRPWTQQEWLNVVELLIDKGANPNAIFETSPEFVHQSTRPKLRTILTDFSDTPWPTHPNVYAGLLDLLSRKGLETNQIVGDKTALDYVFISHFSRFTVIRGQAVSLFAEETIWTVGELIKAGANLLQDGRIEVASTRPSLHARYVDETFIEQVFKPKALQLAFKAPEHALALHITQIFAVTPEDAARLSSKILKQAEAELQQKSEADRLQRDALVLAPA